MCHFVRLILTNLLLAHFSPSGWLVANIFEGSSFTDFGCVSGSPEFSSDGNTRKYYCDRNGINNSSDTSYQVPGIIVTPSNGQLSIPKVLRMYTSNACLGCDPLTFILEGRVNNTVPWVTIDSGELPRVADGLDRNDLGFDINSTYESGDPNLVFTSVRFPSVGDAYWEYRLSFPQTRTPIAKALSYAKIEMAGMMLPLPPSVSPTKVPSMSPSQSPSQSPSTPFPTVQLPSNGELVSNILAGSTFTDFGCISGDPSKSSDSTTNKVSSSWTCDILFWTFTNTKSSSLTLLIPQSTTVIEQA